MVVHVTCTCISFGHCWIGVVGSSGMEKPLLLPEPFDGDTWLVGTDGPFQCSAQVVRMHSLIVEDRLYPQAPTPCPQRLPSLCPYTLFLGLAPPYITVFAVGVETTLKYFLHTYNSPL